MEKAVNPFSGSALVLRRRSVWEAADAGVLLWKNSFVYFLPFFALPVWICACGLRFLPAGSRYLSYLVLWWLKPFFDRFVLHVISVRFFGAGEEASPRRGLAADSPFFSGFRELRRGLLGNLFRGLLGDLLWRRFSPCRSARMPIRVLERPGQKRFRRRKKALASGGLDFCFFLSVFGLVLEGTLLFGEAMFTAAAAQMFFPASFSYISDNLGTLEIFIFAAFCFNFILVESLYVCMGFGLYINSRIELEGWDLQLLFQKFAGGSAAGNQKKSSSSGIGALVFVCLFLTLTPGIRADPGEAASSRDGELLNSAETPDEEIREPLEYFPGDFPAAGDESLNELETILSSPDFGGAKEGWSLRFRDFGEQRERPETDISPLFEKLRRIFGSTLRLLLILAAAGFAGFAFYRLLKHRAKGGFRFPGAGKSFVNPSSAPESPESLFTGAEDFFRRGMIREAWAACFAGCLRACEKYRSLFFSPDATEYGCLEQMRSALPSEAGGFEYLVRNWVLFAYGGKIPAPEDFEKSLAYGRTLLEVPRETAPEFAGQAGGGSGEP